MIARVLEHLTVYGDQHRRKLSIFRSRAITLKDFHFSGLLHKQIVSKITGLVRT